MSFGVREEDGKSMEDLATAATSLPARRRRHFSLIGAKEATYLATIPSGVLKVPWQWDVSAHLEYVNYFQQVILGVQLKQ
jgi:hypothetical protein